MLIAAYADKSDNRPSLSTADRSRSGNPYLYAYLMDANGKIQKYLSGTTTVVTNRPDADYVVYGIFPIAANTRTIRVFLKQSGVMNVSNAGANVTFLRPILVGTSSTTRAKQVLDAYASQDLTLNYQGATIPSGSTTSVTPPPPAPSTSYTTNCAGTKGTNVFNVTFEHGEARNANLRFGSSSPMWTTTASHDYPASYLPYDYVTSQGLGQGLTSVVVSNPTYNGWTSLQRLNGVFYEEALRELTTGLLVPNAIYTVSIHARYFRPATGGSSSVLLTIGQETGADGLGVWANLADRSVSESWTCQEYTFTNTASQTTPQDIVLYFGELEKGARLAIDQIQLIKK